MTLPAASQIGLIWLILANLTGCAMSGAGSMKGEGELIALLTDFGSRNNMDSYQVESMLADLTWNSDRISKGGVGPVNNSLFVSLEDGRNTLFVNDTKWSGGRSTDNQIVFVANGEVIQDVKSADINSSVLILFTPGSIRFFDFANGLAGSYRRMNQ